MTTTIKGKNLDTNLVTLADKPRQMDNGSKYVWAGYKGQKLSVQTPRMSVAFSMKPNTMGEYPKYSVELSFQGMDTDKSLQKFHDNIEAMDNFMIDAGVKNSMAWFKQKKVSRDVIEAKYSTMIKTPTDKETGEVLTQFPQRLRVKVPFYDGKFGCKLFGKDGKEIEDAPLEDILVRGTRVKAIIECVGLWISASGYMCQWKMVRMEADVQKVESGPIFLSDSEDEDEGSETPTSAPEPPAENQPPPAEPEGEDSEDDSEEEDDSDGEDSEEESDDDEDSEEEAPPPPPEPVKKTKGKKATAAKEKTTGAKKKK